MTGNGRRWFYKFWKFVDFVSLQPHGPKMLMTKNCIKLFIRQDAIIISFTEGSSLPIDQKGL